jgi:hypothetical protein
MLYRTLFVLETASPRHLNEHEGRMFPQNADNTMTRHRPEKQTCHLHLGPMLEQEEGG